MIDRNMCKKVEQFIDGDGIWDEVSKEGDQQEKENILVNLAHAIITSYKKEKPANNSIIYKKDNKTIYGSHFKWAQGGKRTGIIYLVANVLANYYPNHIDKIFYNNYPTINGYDHDGDLSPSILLKHHGVDMYKVTLLILDCAVRHPNTPDKTCLELSLKGEKGCSRELNNLYGAIMQIKDGVITYKGKGVTTTNDLGGVERKQ